MAQEREQASEQSQADAPLPSGYFDFDRYRQRPTDQLPTTPPTVVLATSDRFNADRANTPLSLYNHCPYDWTDAQQCRVHWHDLLIDAGAYDAFQNIGNLYSGYTYRFQTTHGKWFDRWIDSAAGWRWTRWSDGNPWLDDYVGHGMMGAITNYIWVENDPKSMTVPQANSAEYRHELLRAFLFSTAFSFQWKLGPFGEAGIGHNGDYYQYENSNIQTPTNETGWVELVTTPVGGTLWTIGEDALDERVVARWEQRHDSPFLLVGYSLLTPAHSTANIFRFRAPWFRDRRYVHAAGVFERRSVEQAVTDGDAVVQRRRVRPIGTSTFKYGGKYEFGTLLGVSLTHDSVFGSTENIKLMQVLVRGSAEMAGNHNASLRYSPEIIATAMLDEPLSAGNDPKYLRTRTYGTGVNPEGFQVVFRPTRPIQPFVDQHLGAIAFFKPVLLAIRPGNNAIYTVSAGAGMNIVRRNGNAITYGYRFEHLAAIAGSSQHATDAHSFYVAVSHFFESRRDVY